MFEAGRKKSEESGIRLFTKYSIKIIYQNEMG